MNPELKILQIEKALNLLQQHERNCRLCPRECGVDRKNQEKGFCQSIHQAVLSHALLHYGEEPVLSGFSDWNQDTKNKKQRIGSGALFFSGCNLKCPFCQNYQLSWHNQGKPVKPEELAEQMLSLQKKGALNINLISPTHIILPLLKSLRLAYRKGLNLPLVYNSNGYEKAEVMEKMEGIIDIYIPDLKYFSSAFSQHLSGAADYFQYASQAISEMHRQHPKFTLDEKEVAQKGLIIRHLVLPGMSEDSLQVLDWIDSNLGPSICVSLMSQYKPCYKAPSELQRTLSPEEYNKVLQKAKKMRLDTLFFQPEPFSSEQHLTPDFNLKDPFGFEERN